MSEKRNVWLPRELGTTTTPLFGVLAVAAAAAVFVVDTYTHIEGAIAVLYVIPLLLMAEVASRFGLVLITVGCIALSIISYVQAHGASPDLQTTVRLFVALAALCVTSALLLRNYEARARWLERNVALLESERRYRSIFDLTRVAIWERDYSQLHDLLMELKRGGVTDVRDYARTHPGFLSHCISKIGIVAANDAAIALLGPSAGGGAAGVMTRFISPTSESFTAVLQAILDGARSYEDKVDLVTEQGEAKTVLLSMGFPSDPQSFNRVIVSMVDITQREQDNKALAVAQAELARASRATTAGVLSASLAHELNQPLGAIVVASQTLLRWLDRDPPDVGAARRTAERMVRDGERASAIIQNTRSKISLAEPGIEDVDIAALVPEILTLMEHELQREKAAVELVQEAKIPPVPAVKVEIQQVLINLVTNAMQAMSAADVEIRRIIVTIDAPAGSETVAVAVRDTGPGLNPDTLEKLFEPFYTSKANGMGIGLSICRSMLEARGGALVGFNHPAGGAVFEMRLPKFLPSERNSKSA